MITNKHTDTHCITSGNKLFYAAVTGRDHSQIVTMGRIGSQHTIRVQSSNSKTGCCLKFFVTILAITVIVLVGVIIWLIYRAPTASDGSAYLFQSGPSTASGGFIEDAVCKLPKDVGPCRGALLRYYFNYETKRCDEFIYGGCKGNANNFQTILECQELCMKPATKIAKTDVCKLPQDVGPCKAMIPRFAYDDNLKACVPFTYGGCQGNGNNFETKEQCEAKCMALTDNACKQPIKVGPCLALIPRYGFDPTVGKCVQFMYGGCEQNENNFETLEACQEICQAAKAEETDVCKLPQDVGPCKARIQRITYDDTIKACVPFTYGGCQGNGNNFETKEECEKKCVAKASTTEETDVCKLPQYVGPCRARIQRFAYDANLKACVPFTYGGCQGNGNNFETKEQCEAKCMGSLPYVQGKGLPERCTLPLSKGPCNMHWRRYAYSSQDNTCRLFIYGGCQGNENNFATREECERECKRPS
uniref:BPTI/Kunitz inhibitor domain-containing protein n=2 Tax=Schistocephalus solidus TaxID=70667 RepID=A0A0X3P7B9_SCHSO